MEKMATGEVILGKDTSKWVRKIITAFLTQNPKLQNAPITVTWVKKDINKLYAVGYIAVGSAKVPVIIKSAVMSPLDVIIFKGVAYPLVEDLIMELMAKPDPFKYVSTPGSKDALELFNPDIEFYSGDYYHGGGTTRPAKYASSCIDKIEHIDKESVTTLLKMAVEPEVQQQFQENDTVVVLEKIATKDIDSKEKQIDTFTRQLEIDRQLVTKDTYGNYFIKQANAHVDHVWEVQITKKEAEGHEMMCNKSEYIANTASQSYVVDDLVKLSHEIAKNDAFLVPGKNSVGENGVFLTIFDKKAALYIEPEKNWCIVDDFDNLIKVAGSAIKIGGDHPEVNDYGVWVIGNKSSSPFTITKMQKNASGVGNFEIYGFDGLKSTRYRPIRLNADALVPDEVDKHAYFVPGNAKFVKLGKDLSKNQAQLYVPKNFVGRDDVGLYYVEGESFSKYGESHELRDMSKAAVRWALIHCNAAKSEVEKVASLENNSKITLHSPIKSPYTPSEVCNTIVEEYEKNSGLLTKFNLNLVKEAAVINDKGTVDAILSLGLMRKHNIGEYVGLIPSYEVVMSNLSNLLISTRLGIVKIPEELLQKSLVTIARVLMILKRLQTMAREKVNNV